MYPKRWLIAFGVLGFLAGTLAFLPARMAFAVVPWTRLSLPPPQEVQGTLWDGSARLSTSRGLASVSWTVNGWALLLARAQADVRVAAPDLTGEGSLRFGLLGRQYRIARAEVGAGSLRGLLSGSRVGIDQPLQVRDLVLDIAGREVHSASGLLAWGPGTVRLQGGDAIALPALHGRLSTGADGRVRVDVDSEREPGKSLGAIDADAGLHEIHVAVRQRGLNLAGKGGSGPARSPDDIVFELKQPLR